MTLITVIVAMMIFLDFAIESTAMERILRFF